MERKGGRGGCWEGKEGRGVWDEGLREKDAEEGEFVSQCTAVQRIILSQHSITQQTALQCSHLMSPVAMSSSSWGTPPGDGRCRGGIRLEERTGYRKRGVKERNVQSEREREIDRE